MDELIARELEVTHRIQVEQIAREWWEMIILKDIFDSPLGSSLVFKGGTALRLSYGSPRFSSDLDFSCLKPLDFSLFQKIVKTLENKFDELRVKDIWNKHYTIIAEYRVKEAWLEQPFSIKIEISKRSKNIEFESTVLSSSISNLEVIGNVYTMNQILKEKRIALKTRIKARDVFDLWYIGQKMKIHVDISEHKIPLKQLTQEIQKYLPTNYWQVIPALIREKK